MTRNVGWWALGLVACAGGGTGKDEGPTGPSSPPESYVFPSRFAEGDSVAYDGQVMRHLLILDLRGHVDGLTARIDQGALFPVEGEVAAELDFWFSFDSTTSGSVAIRTETDPPAAQAVWDDVSTGKDLVGKIAGNDPEGQHRDWSTAFAGWEQPGVTTPESLVRTWFAELDAAAVARGQGEVPLGPTGAPIGSVALSPDGRDRAQLLQKFLLGAVAFSQGADDYLDDDLPGSGLLADHSAAEEGEPYTALEHAWDEAFGYFGASRRYGLLSDEVIADPTWEDAPPADGAIDRRTEVVYGHAQNAAKRDLGAVAATDFTAEAWAGFLDGRHLLASTDGPLADDELDALRAHRDRAVGAWEAAIAASAVHYLNEVLAATATFDDPSYDFAAHAKAWSEMKGFALSLQFNPRSPLSDADFAAVHAAMGTAPVLPGASPAAVEAHRDALRTARSLLGDAYGFDRSNLGDDDGYGGW